MKKLRIGWFTFTCCEDSTIVFTELLNTHWEQWKDKITFIHAKVLQNTNKWEPMDVAFVEGAISSQEQEDRLKKIRGLANKVVAIGACACTGLPSGQRNRFDEKTKNEIKEILLKFHHTDMVKTLREIITVDDSVNGCPMSEQAFLTILDKYLHEFEITGSP